MIVGSLLLNLLMMAAPTTSPATQSSTAPAALTELVAQLSNEDAAVRDAAQTALASLEGITTDSLQRARDASTDPDVQLRLDALIVQFAENDAVGATHVTLKFENAPLRDVLNELARQARCSFTDPAQDFGNEAPRVTIDVNNVTFWKAVAALQTAANINIFPQPDNWRVMRNFGNQLFGPNVIEAGAFLIQPMSANYQRTIGYTRNMGSGESFTIQMQMLTEPKIRLAQAAGQFKLTKAIDSNGNSLLGSQALNPFVTGVGGNQIQMATQLAYPKNPGEKIAELSGTFKLSIARRVQTISIDDFSATSKPVEQTFEGAKLTISPADATGGQPNWINASIIVETAGDNALMGRLMNTLRQVRLVDQNNRALQMTNWLQPMASPQRTEIRISYMPIPNGEMTAPYRLILDIPTSFREVEVPFTLHDLKMP